MQVHLRSPELLKRLRLLAYLSLAFAAICSVSAWMTAFPAVHEYLASHGFSVPMMTADDRVGVYALSGLFCFFGGISYLGSQG